MRRKNIPQITRSKYCPTFLKKLVSEFLSWFVLKTNATKPFVPVINNVIERSELKSIINIEFNVGAGMDTVKKFLSEEIKIHSVLEQNFSTSKNGIYTFINCFHQLSALKAKKYLEAIIKSKNPIVIVEGNNDSLWQIVGMTVFVPLTVILASPFVQPFRFSRLIFTYLIPILPIIIVIDGCIALLKLYNPKDLNSLILSLDSSNYYWQTGKRDNGRGGKIIYLKGIPT